MKHLVIFLAASLLAAAGCEQKPAEPKPDDPTSKNSTSASAATTAAAPVPIADSDLATPADFEDSAEKAITKANYKAELATLETDIAKE